MAAGPSQIPPIRSAQPQPITLIAGRRVMFVMAVEAEYGPELRARFLPLFTGVGPVEAAVETTAALAAYHPDLVISVGSSGSARLPQGGVYQALSVSYRDMDASPFGFQRGETPFSGLPVALELGLPVGGLAQARLSTGADVVSGAAYAAIDADMVDMESYAVLRACQKFGTPLIVLRGISDGAKPLEGVEDWSGALPDLDGKLAEAVDRVTSALVAGELV